LFTYHKSQLPKTPNRYIKNHELPIIYTVPVTVTAMTNRKRSQIFNKINLNHRKNSYNNNFVFKMASKTEAIWGFHICV